MGTVGGCGMKAGWQIKTLGEVLEKTETVNPLQTPDTEFDYIDVSSVSNTTFVVEQTQRLMGKDAPSRARKLVKTNDVIFATIRPTLRRIAIVPPHLNQQVCSTGYFVLRPKANLYHRYMYYWLFSEEFMGQMGLLQKGASYPAVTDKEVRDQAIPFPPLHEQQRIVTLLDKAFDGIAIAKANAEKNLQNAGKLFESHLESVLSRRQKNWSDFNLGKLCQVKTGKKDVNQGNPGGQFPFFTCAAEHTYSDSYSFDTEALLIAGNGNVGQVSYYSGKFEAYQRTYVLSDFKGVHAKYMFRVLDKRLSATVSKLKLGNTMPYIKIGMLTDHVVPVPTLAEQKLITDELDSVASEIDRLKSIYVEKSEALIKLEKSLLHSAFNGDL
jgi:type I restriction enzyme S subunit